MEDELPVPSWDDWGEYLNEWRRKMGSETPDDAYMPKDDEQEPLWARELPDIGTPSASDSENPDNPEVSVD